MEQTSPDQPPVRRVGRPRKVEVPPVPSDRDLAQHLAERIWAGQSSDLPRHERIARVTRGVEAQGFSMEGVVLP